MATNKPWYVYILECHDESLYTGITNDLKKRMDTHKSGKGSKYVKAKGFKQILHAIEVKDKSEAAKMENQEIINDLIIAAYNNAKENLKKKSAEELSKATGGLNLPLDFKLPF